MNLFTLKMMRTNLKKVVMTDKVNLDIKNFAGKISSQSFLIECNSVFRRC